MWRRLLGFGLTGLLLTMSSCASKQGRAADATSQGQALYEAGDYKAASEKFSEAVALRDDDASIWLAKARNETRLKNYGAAFASYAAALELDSANREALDGVAQLALASGDLDMAMRTSEQILALSPDDPSGQFVHAAVLIQKGRLDEASRTVESGLKSKPANQNLLILKSQILADKGDLAAAEQVLPSLGNDIQPSPRLLQQWQEIYAQKFDGKGLAKVAELEARGPNPDFDVKLTLGQRRAALGDIDRALDAFSDMLASIKTERAERDVSLALARADVPADRLASRIAAGKRRDGRLYRAVAYYFLSIERYDLAADAISMIVANIGQARNDIGLLAYVAATHGDRARAASLAQSRLVEEPRDDWALLARALVLAKAGKLEGALRDASIAGSDARDSTEAVRVLASIYRLRGEQQLAEKAVVAAFNANRDSEFLLRLLARQMSENGRIHALTEILRSFVLRNPESVMGWRLRAHFCRIALQPACATRADAIVKALRGEAVALPATPADERRIHYMGR